MGSRSDEQRGPSSQKPASKGVGRRVAIALALIPTAVFTPLLVAGRTLGDLWADATTRSLLITAAWLLVAGTIVFMIIEGLSPIDSFYFSFVTLATIGYGDIALTSELGKIVAVIYGISGLGVMASLISAIARRRVSRRHGRGSSGREEPAA
jgi:voltage-gated potassium channel